MTIILRCFECEERYRVRDDRAGKRVKCKKCGTILQIPPKDEDLPKAKDGTTIFRHEMRDREFQLAVGDSENIEAISDHLEQHIGPADMVFHELISDMVHVDVHWVKPTRQRPWHTLVTSGMSDLPMVVPDELEEYAHAEIYVQLPADWKISEEAFESERWYWPVRLIKLLARLPHEFETWLGTGHTVPNGDPAEPYADNTRLSCALLLPGISVPEDFHRMESPHGYPVWFYNVYPLYEEETTYKLNHGLDALLDKFDKADVSDILDINRPNVCRKKWFGLF